MDHRDADATGFCHSDPLSYLNEALWKERVYDG